MTREEYEGHAEGSTRSAGTCNTMGTASTMTSLADTMGLTLPGLSSVPAVDARHAQLASDTGRRAVEMVWEDLRPSKVVTPASLRNAVVTDMALAGSTNSLIHLIAMARRLGLSLSLEDFSGASGEVPVICNLMPTGQYLMEDFYFAGGILGLLKRLAPLIDLNCRTVNGKTLGENIEGAGVWDDDVIRPLDNPVYPTGGLIVLRGSLAPDGAVMKRSAASAELLSHTGPAVVFKNRQDMLKRIDDPDLTVSRDSVLVLQDAGPVGAPGMPEWGMMPIPKKLLAEGVRDMVRISDGRMSGTSFGTCILHVSPESRIGGPLAFVEDGDQIGLDAASGRLDLLIDGGEIERRRANWIPPPPHYGRGYGELFSQHVTQANDGCDFDFLARRSPINEPEVH